MPDTHDFGDRFVHSLRVGRRTPVHHRAVTVEYDEPFRISNSHVFHLWPTGRALALGRWRDSGLTEDEALRAAIWVGDDLDVVDADGHILPEFEHADFPDDPDDF